MNNLKVGIGKLSITKKKINYQKSRPKITRPATAKVKSSETSRDLNGYLEPLTHLCTVIICFLRPIRRDLTSSFYTTVVETTNSKTDAFGKTPSVRLGEMSIL